MRNLPIHQLISDQLRNEIQQGKFPLGSRLPTEEELCVTFKTSRPTLRQALSTLSHEGLIHRRPRTGSTVIATEMPVVLSHAVNTVNELLDYPGVMTRQILETSQIKADAVLAQKIQCELHQEWFRITSLRFQNHANLPLCLTTYYILPKYADVVKHPQYLSKPISELIVDMFPETIEKARVEVYSQQLSADESTALKAKDGSSALVVMRTYTGKDHQVFQITVSSHPEDRYRYSFELKREARLNPQNNKK